MKQQNVLFLFDIDGTLVKTSGPTHRRALLEAVRQLTGAEVSLNGFRFHGAMDTDILSALLQQAGCPVAQTELLLPKAIELAQELYVQYDSQNMQLLELCPGVLAFLEQLKQAGVPRGIVTGNLKIIAERKLASVGLTALFSFGAYANEGSSRARLLHLALQRAKEKGLIDVPQPAAIFVGDSPRDVEAAREAGCFSLAVGTGVCPADELLQARPDWYVPTLATCSLDSILRSLAAKT